VAIVSNASVRGRRFTAHCVLAVAAALWLDAARGETAAPNDHEVKAAFIYNFAKYIRWPESSASRKTFRIGLAGKSPVGHALDEALRGRELQGRPIVVRRLDSVEEVGQCDIVFVPASEKGNLKAILEAARDAPVLTVGDMENFTQSGGMINLFTEERRVRFEMNVEAAERAGLTPSSQLLRLARIVAEPRASAR
jgi:hypothetical protein